jgi:hypothetical protein
MGNFGLLQRHLHENNEGGHKKFRSDIRHPDEFLTWFSQVKCVDPEKDLLHDRRIFLFYSNLEHFSKISFFFSKFIYSILRFKSPQMSEAVKLPLEHINVCRFVTCPDI